MLSRRYTLSGTAFGDFLSQAGSSGVFRDSFWRFPVPSGQLGGVPGQLSPQTGKRKDGAVGVIDDVGFRGLNISCRVVVRRGAQSSEAIIAVAVEPFAAASLPEMIFRICRTDAFNGDSHVPDFCSWQYVCMILHIRIFKFYSYF